MFRVLCSLVMLPLGLQLGCGGPTQVGSQPSFRSSEFRSVTAASPSDWVVFSPTSPSATHYNSKENPHVKPAKLAMKLVSGLLARAQTKGISLPRIDPRLVNVAQELATIVPENGPPPYQLIEFAMHHQGLVEPSPLIIVVRGGGDTVSIADELAIALHNAQESSGAFSRMGLGHKTLDGGDSVTLLALQHSFVVTNPVPRVLPKTGLIVFQGTVLAPFRQPRVHVERSDGSVIELPIEREGLGGFRARIGCARRSGKQRIEVTASDHTGSTVLANFPVWCASQPVDKIRVSLNRAKPAVSTVAAEDALLSRVNEERARHKLAPVVLSSRVRAVARAHSLEMRTTGRVVHVSERTGSASDRVLAAAIYNTAVMENVARAYGVEETHEGLMNSPGHRSNILSPLATHIGIGVHFGEHVAGRRELFVTQLLIRVPPQISVAEARNEVTRKIKASNSLQHDQRLSTLAREYALEIARGVPPGQVSLSGNERQFSLQREFRSLTTMTTTLLDVETFDATRIAASSHMSHYGLSVVTGASPKSAGMVFHIVVILAEGR